MSNSDSSRGPGGPFTVIHIGLPKTGTSLLQRHLFPRHPGVLYLGKFLGSSYASKYRNDAVEQLFASLPSDAEQPPKVDLSSARQQYHDWLDQECPTGGVPVWSSESLTHGPSSVRQARAHFLQEVFGDCRVMITLRHPVSFIESYYLQKIKQGNVLKKLKFGQRPFFEEFDSWLDRHWNSPGKGDLSFLCYAETIEIFSQVFGREAIRVWLFEQLIEDANTYAESICEFMGIDVAEGAAHIHGKTANRRQSATEIERIRNIRRSFLLSSIFRIAPTPIRRRMLARSRQGISDKASVRISDFWRNRIENLTRPGNLWLSKEFGLPLEQRGYPT